MQHDSRPTSMLYALPTHRDRRLVRKGPDARVPSGHSQHRPPLCMKRLASSETNPRRINASPRVSFVCPSDGDAYASTSSPSPLRQLPTIANGRSGFSYLPRDVGHPHHERRCNDNAGATYCCNGTSDNKKKKNVTAHMPHDFVFRPTCWRPVCMTAAPI